MPALSRMTKSPRGKDRGESVAVTLGGGTESEMKTDCLKYGSSLCGYQDSPRHELTVTRKRHLHLRVQELSMFTKLAMYVPDKWLKIIQNRQPTSNSLISLLIDGETGAS